MEGKLYDLSKKVGEALKEKGLMIAVAESCSGGLLAEILTEIAGSSTYFERGFVTYSNVAKQEMLGVSAKTLEDFGAVSEEVAREMAEGALKNSHAQIAISTTGVAGPDGGTKEKPVGTVCMAWAQEGRNTKTAKVHFDGDRALVRIQAAQFVLERLLAGF